MSDIAISIEVENYYESAPDTHKKTLNEMRKRIRSILPNATEIIKYKMPTFVIEDNICVVGLLYNKKHIGYYPYSGDVIHKFPELCEKYKTTTGSLHVPIDKPLLKSEINKLIKERIAVAKRK
jgi:uncharacterized protein YdhG (YjbR/CyaY superfamily)